LVERPAGFRRSRRSLSEARSSTLQEVSEKLSKATVDVVSLQEKQRVARIHLQTGVGDLSLEPMDAKQDSATAAK
jgi:hypothetical protein